MATLIEEHWTFRDEVRAFLKALGGTERDRPPSPMDPRRVDAFVTFLSDDVDQRHGGKEEQGLFPVLARRVPEGGGPIAPFLAEHEDLRGHRSAVARAAEKLRSDPEDTGSAILLLRESEELQQLLCDHVEREDTMLFPLAREVLTVEDVAEVSAVFLRLEKELGPARAAGQRTLPRGGPALTPFCPAGRANKDVAGRG